MNYKVGDKVIPIHKEDGNYNIIGKVGIIIEVMDNRLAKVKFDEDIEGWGEGNRFWNIKFDNLKPFSYSWEDFKKCPIGTKIYFENDEIVLKYSDNNYGNYNRNRDLEDLADFKDNRGFMGKIIRIEEPVEYNTYYINYEPEPKEMTIKEISDILGYDIKIIKEEDKNK